MSEATVWRQLRAGLPSGWAAKRLTDRFLKGLPDVVWTGEGRTGFLELKDWGGAVSQEQLLFLREWAAAGGTGWIVQRMPNGWALFEAEPLPSWVRRFRLGRMMPTGTVRLPEHVWLVMIGVTP